MSEIKYDLPSIEHSRRNPTIPNYKTIYELYKNLFYVTIVWNCCKKVMNLTVHKTSISAYFSSRFSVVEKCARLTVDWLLVDLVVELTMEIEISTSTWSSVPIISMGVQQTDKK